MPLRTSLVGTETVASTVRVEVRHILAFAAATGDANPRHFDDSRDDLVAPPCFVSRLQWAARRFAPWLETGLTDEEAASGLHAGADIRFHRLICPGDEVTTQGRVVAVRAIPPGALLVQRYEVLDAAGQAVATLDWSSIFPGVATDGPDAVVEEPPTLPQVPAAGRPLWEIRQHVGRELPHIYTECADIWNPIHTERRVAAAAGLPDIILHGTATLSLASRHIVDREAEGVPERLARVACQFRAMVIPGTDVRVRLLGKSPAPEGTALHFDVLNEEGRPAIGHAVAVLRLRPS